MSHSEPKTDPVIVIGMHRSGTTMVTQMLERLGLFVGRAKDDNWEAHFFRRLNDWVLWQCGVSWDEPVGSRWLAHAPRVREQACDYLELSLRSPRVVSYLGAARWARARTPYRLAEPWGWKDPRNTFTLPLWMQLFPRARIVHVFRHGVDVANSLCVRQVASIERKVARYRRRRWLHRFAPKRARLTESPRCTTLEGAFSLWEEYTRQSRLEAARHADRAMEIRYEDFLASPRPHLERLARFCGLPADDGAIDRAAGQIKPERAFAYRRKPELTEFARQAGQRLADLGYSDQDMPAGTERLRPVGAGERP